ncbi:MAG TPA: efflux RND transporter periplasmic adaptor subunit [Acidobacteriota bacterium]|nr:efflux RND transporter periplasmic adaptor subunit [Acidobacteriota bacterium]
MKFRIALLALIVLSIALSGAYFKDTAEEIVGSYFKSGIEDPIPTVKVRSQDYTLTVAADGELTGLEMQPVLVPRVPRGSLTIAWLEKEGTIVTKGQTLVRFDDSDAVLYLQQYKNTAETYESRIEKSREDARSQDKIYDIDYTDAEMELDFAQSQVRQDEEIFSRWEIEESIMSAALAEYRKTNVKRKASLSRELSDADLKILEIESGRAESEVKLAEQTLSALEIKAPASGVMLYRRLGWGRTLTVGTEVWPGMTLMEIADLEKFQGKLNVVENDIAGVQPGNIVRVSLAAFPTYKITGKVKKVASAAQQIVQADPRKYFVCEVVLDVPLELMDKLKPGMKMFGQIEIGRRDGAIVVPRSAVIKKGNESIVFVKENGSYSERKVTIQDADYGFYLLDGLRGGEEVCLQHPFEKQKLRLPDFSAPAPAATRGRRFAVAY